MWIAVLSFIVICIICWAGWSSRRKSNTKNDELRPNDIEFVHRLSYLLQILIEHSASERRLSSTREIIRIGEEINTAGGFRYMVKIHQAVAQQTSEKAGVRLKSLWKGIGDWRSG
jgi:hypothetical protein